jgi:hypothetical protein
VPNLSGTTFEDVTPVGISINSGNVPVHIVSVTMQVAGVTQSVMVLSDNTSRPWIASNLTASPVTGASIDFDGLGTAWTAYGSPQVWQGAVFFILDHVGVNGRRQDIAYSEPGQPDIGYQQVGFSNWLTPTKHATGALTALSATNTALYYFRANSIGVIYGALATLASSNTDDAVAFNIGTTACRTIQQYGPTIYFCDELGRPYRFTPGSIPEPIWHQMRSVVQDLGGNAMAQLTTYASSVIEPTLNLYLVTIWRADATAGTDVMPVTIYAFNAATGKYNGTWSINDQGAGGVGVSVMGILEGVDGNEPTLCVLGESVVGSQSLGFLWYLRIRGTPFPDAAQWFDNVAFPYVTATTDRMGEEDDTVWNIDRATIITGNASPCEVSVHTTTMANDIIGTPTPSPSQDETFRLVVGCDLQGRGPSVTVRAMQTDPTVEQWNVQRVRLTAVPSQADPVDA